MNIYVAAPWAHITNARDAALFLKNQGHTVVSRWLTEHGDASTHEALQEQAVADMADVLWCEAFVLLNLALSEGKASEFGMIYMANVFRSYTVPVIVVGEVNQKNIFYHLPGVQVVPTLEDALPLLR